MDAYDTMPMIIVVTHFINFICILLLIRSGIQILNDHPLLYWTDHTRRDNYWLKFGRKEMPKDKLWTAHDEAGNLGKYALPGGGHKNFGAARNWHFATAVAWVVSGLVYWVYLIGSGQWRTIIPTSWKIFPEAWSGLIHYLQFQKPPLAEFQPLDPIQQVTYALVVTVLPLIMIATALAMSPAFTARFPRYVLLFGGRRQVARSIHFLGMLAFSLFILIHVTLVSLVYFERNIKLITLGSTHVTLGAALGVMIAALVLVLAFNVWITFFTLNHKVGVRRFLVSIFTPVVRVFLGRMFSRQKYSRKDISSFFRINGYPPETREFDRLRDDDYRDWRLKVTGLVEQDLSLSLADIKKLPKQSQITKHICIQGWSAIGEWGGVPMQEIIDLCRPKTQAKYVVFHAYDVDENKKPFYEALRLRDMTAPQTILAYEMNGKPLSLEHGAPLRLRCEHKLGYKMVKYIKSIEFVDNYKRIGEGRGGYREDNVLFDWEASI